MSVRWRRALIVAWVVRAAAFAVLAWLVLFVCDVTGIGLVIVGILALVIFVVAPYIARTMFRERISRMRRTVVRDMDNGDLPRARRTWSLLPFGATEDRASDVTLLHLVVFELLYFSDRFRRKLKYDEYDDAWTRVLVKVKPKRSKKIRMYDARWRKHVALHLFIGTPFGWIAGALFALFLGLMVLATLVTRPNRTLIKWRVMSKLKAVGIPLARRVKYETGAGTSPQ